MILSVKNEENESMKKAKYGLIALVSGVLAATAVLSGCGQSKKEISKNDEDRKSTRLNSSHRT